MGKVERIMKTFIFHYQHRVTGQMAQFKTKALNRIEAETHYWNWQVKLKSFVKYKALEQIENRQRKQL